MPDAHSTPLIEAFTLGPFATNCYVVRAPETDECWIIDAGAQPDDMIGAIQRHELNPSKIILTHAHADHIVGLPQVRQAFPGVPLLIHHDEQDWLANPTLNLSANYGTPFSTDPADHLLQGGETLQLGDAHFNVLHTPGHSPGGITLHCPDAAVALVGDTLFAGSIGRFDFPTSNEADLFRSIGETLYALPDATKVYPGHGPPTSIGREKTSNPYVRAK